MWYKEDRRYPKRKYANRRLNTGRNSILMVSARASEQRKQRMHRVGALVLMTVVLVGASWMIMTGAQFVGERLFSMNDRFVIEHLRVSSDGILQKQHVKEYAHVEEGMNLFAVDIQKVREDLEVMPVVDSVQVTRKLPDTLAVLIRERIAKARLGDESTGYPLAMDREGVVLGPRSVSSQLPFISGFRMAGLRPGVRIDDPGVRTALQVLDVCDEPGFSSILQVKKVDVSHSDYLDIRLSRGERVLLSLDKVKPKLKHLCKIIKKSAESGRAVAAVDMTVDKNFPVKYR